LCVTYAKCNVAAGVSRRHLGAEHVSGAENGAEWAENRVEVERSVEGA